MAQKDNGETDLAEGSRLLMVTFPPEEINRKPVPTRRQTEEVKQNPSYGIWCDICGGFHHAKARHLDYVGHAAVTRRLLEVDPGWDWDFLIKHDSGAPMFDDNSGLWITLTVLGVTRKGYGSADGKQGPNATKEIIGDAIRNAAMRFGVALELWHKGEFAQSELSTGEDSSQEDAESCMPEEQFNSGFPKWEALILDGKKTADDIIGFINSKGGYLSQPQLDAINKVGAD